MHPYSQGSRETSGSTFVTPQKQLKDKPAVLLKLNESVNPDHKNAISSAQNEHLPTIDDLIKVKCDAYYYIKRCKPDTAEQMFRKLYPDHMSSLPECHRIEVITGLVQAMNDQCKSLDAEGLLLKYRDNPGDPTIPSGNKYIDIALSRTWQRMHKYKSAEELLLAIVNRTPQMSMAEQCKPSDEQRINQELATLWISMGHYPMANEISPKKL
nr:hypothetical protein [Endozoicomonas sp.]